MARSLRAQLLTRKPGLVAMYTFALCLIGPILKTTTGWFGMAWWKVGGTALPVIGLVIVFPEQPLIAFSAGIIGLSVSTGTACGSGSISPSEVLSAMNVPLEKIRGMIRISLSRNNTLSQVNRFFEILKKIIHDCRQTASVA